MSLEQEEYRFPCPYCGEPISMLLDLSVEAQRFIEDCENCCHPIEIRYSTEDGAVVSFDADRT